MTLTASDANELLCDNHSNHAEPRFFFNFKERFIHDRERLIYDKNDKIPFIINIR